MNTLSLGEIKCVLDALESRYNPEFDSLKDFPEITYSDFWLIETCKALIMAIEMLEKDVARIERDVYWRV